MGHGNQLDAFAPSASSTGELRDNVIVLGNDQPLAFGSRAEDGSILLVSPSGGAIPTVAPGAIVLGGADQGRTFLQISSVQREERGVRVSGTPPQLDEVFEQASIRVALPVEWSQAEIAGPLADAIRLTGAKQAGGEFELDGLEIPLDGYELGNDTVEGADGEPVTILLRVGSGAVRLTPIVVFEANIDPEHGLTRLAIALRARAELEIGVEGEVSGAVEWNWESPPIVSFRNTVPFTIAGWPAWVTTSGGVQLVASAEMHAGLSFETRLATSYEATVGAIFEDGEWHEWQETRQEADPVEPTLDTNAGFEVRAGGRCSVSIEPYDVVGPTAYLEVYEKLAGSLHADPVALLWALISGANGGVDFNVHLLDFELASFTQELFNTETTVAQGSIPLDCRPSCGDAECGDNGCGGSCGACGAGTACHNGQCEPEVCMPECGNQECGDDGCGGDTCGSCQSGQVCIDGQCECAPQCDGAECGDDGCHGECGRCGAGDHCELGLCVPLPPQCTDDDGDGYGVGCPLGGDCNDDDPWLNTVSEEVCNGNDDDCDGQTDEGVENECGGCGDLQNATGSACGPCRNGTWRCDDSGGQSCVGATQNDCGGCSVLEEQPGTACGAGGCGELQCDGTDALTCQDVPVNACGECGPAPIEQCNGEDDDCDGQDDEGAVCPGAQTCRDRACRVCAAGSPLSCNGNEMRACAFDEAGTMTLGRCVVAGACAAVPEFGGVTSCLGYVWWNIGPNGGMACATRGQDVANPGCSANGGIEFNFSKEHDMVIRSAELAVTLRNTGDVPACAEIIANGHAVGPGTVCYSDHLSSPLAVGETRRVVIQLAGRDFDTRSQSAFGLTMRAGTAEVVGMTLFISDASPNPN